MIRNILLGVCLLLLSGTAARAADRCQDSATVDQSSVSGNQRVIAPTRTTAPVYICGIDISWATDEITLKITYGTAVALGGASNCGTSTVTKALIKSARSWSKEWLSPLRIPPGMDVCLNYGSSVSPGGTLTYAN